MKRLVLFTLSLLALLAAACGGGGSSNNEPQAVTLDFKGFDEFRYDPESTSVPAGSQVTVNFENAGVLEHNWLLLPSNVAPTEASEADALGGATSGLTPGGETETFTFAAPPTGTYQVVCTVPGHAAGGMVATFVVE